MRIFFVEKYFFEQPAGAQPFADAHFRKEVFTIRAEVVEFMPKIQKNREIMNDIPCKCDLYIVHKTEKNTR